jgi:hypothetical protein
MPKTTRDPIQENAYKGGHMAEDGDSERIVELATESVAPIEEELRQRLAMELTDKQSLAIETALLKAFINGMRTGSAETVGRVLDLPAPPIGLSGRQSPTFEQLDPQLPWLDPWADAHGAG